MPLELDGQQCQFEAAFDKKMDPRYLNCCIDDGCKHRLPKVDHHANLYSFVLVMRACGVTCLNHYEIKSEIEWNIF